MTDTLRTICLGDENDIEKFLDTGEVSHGFSPKQLEISNQIQGFRQEEGIGTTDIRAQDMARQVYLGVGSGHTRLLGVCQCE